jgi:hypothetical protein
MKKLILLLFVATVAQANDQCVLQERTVSKNNAVIVERSTVRRDIVPFGINQRKCLVDFKVRIGSEWYTAFGEHTWSGEIPNFEACAMAVHRAESDAITRASKGAVTSERILVCKDREELRTLRNTQLGTVGDVGQFRPHPEYPNRFYHNGTQCRMFVEPAFTGRDVRTYQGVVCEITNQKWVVVDKF